jgi:hypothetical protein
MEQGRERSLGEGTITFNKKYIQNKTTIQDRIVKHIRHEQQKMQNQSLLLEPQPDLQHKDD